MSYLRSFAPWIAYVVASAVADWRLGAVAGLAVALWVVLDDRRSGGADLLSVVTAGFFAVLAPVAIVAPDAVLRPYTPALSLATLGLAATASLALGRPFTLPIARRETPPELWETDLFHRVNVVITAAWATSFLVTAALCAGVISVDASLTPLWVGVQVVGFSAPLVFTRRYRVRVAASLAA
ncbi:MAG: hypothetical protein R2726_01815 [Acidimicrobiales bacterium]